MDDKGIATPEEIEAFLKRIGKKEIPKCPPTGPNISEADAAELEAHREHRLQLRKAKGYNWAQREGSAISKRGRPADASVMIDSPPPRSATPTPKVLQAQKAVAAPSSPEQPNTRATKPQRAAAEVTQQVERKGGRPRFSAEKDMEIIGALTVYPDAAKVARELGVSHSTVYRRAKAAGIDLTAKAAEASERMTRMNADPTFAARNAAMSRERMTRMNTDPEFKAKRISRAHRPPASEPC